MGKVTLHGDGGGSMGVVIGRFQVPDLTEAHKSLFDYVLARTDHLLVILGERHAPPSDRHPLNAETRKTMILDYLREVHPHVIGTGNYMIVTNPDARSDHVWSDEVDHLIKYASRSMEAPDRAVLYGGRDSFIPYYHGSYETKFVPFNEGESGTIVRSGLGKFCASSVERRGYIKAINDIGPRDVLMVDTIVMCQRDGYNDCILLGKKKGWSDYRFPGGAIDPGEATEDAATRELREETGVKISPTEWRPVPGLISIPVDDWRVADSNITYRTNVMYAFTEHQRAHENDDLSHVEWVPVVKIENGEAPIVTEHMEIMRKFLYSNLRHERIVRR